MTTSIAQLSHISLRASHLPSGADQASPPWLDFAPPTPALSLASFSWGPALQKSNWLGATPRLPVLPADRFPQLYGVMAAEAPQGLGPTGLVPLSFHEVCKERQEVLVARPGGSSVDLRLLQGVGEVDGHAMSAIAHGGAGADTHSP